MSRPQSVDFTPNDIESGPPGARLQEVLQEIMQCVLKNDPKFDCFRLTSRRHPLAPLARVSRQFYALVTPLLYRQIQVSPLHCRPFPVFDYLDTPHIHLFRHVRTVKLDIIIHRYIEEPGTDQIECEGHERFLSSSLRVLQAATSIQNIELDFSISYPNRKTFRNRTRINNLIFVMLRHIDTLSLRMLKVLPPSSPQMLDVMSILAQKVTHLHLSGITFESWVDPLWNCRNLSSLEIFGTPGMDATTAFDNFWTALSQLPSLKTILSSSVPFPSTLNIQFPYLVALTLCFCFSIDRAADWASSLKFVMRQMPNLEKLVLRADDGRIDDEGTDENSSGTEGDSFEAISRTIDVVPFNCHKLRIIQIFGLCPKQMIASIASHCTDLEELTFDTSNIDDDDLRFLTRCQQLRKIELLSSNEITTGVSYLTHFPKLREVELHLSMGCYITTEILVDLARKCPLLDKIDIWDQDFDMWDQGFDDWNPAPYFAVGEDMLGYIREMDEDLLDSGVHVISIDIDRLRKDRCLV